MAEPVSERPPGAERAIFRFARFMARYGGPGAILAFLMLRAAALTPVAINLKTAKLLPVVLFCCYEVTWLFGWVAGALIILQYAAHELAHVSSARACGRIPGWYGFIPLAGPYFNAGGNRWTSREAEARVALDGQIAGLAAASGLYAASVLFESPLLRLSAFCGFLFNLVQLLPLRPLDGGRLFPGLDWPASDRADATLRLRLSLAFARLAHAIAFNLGLEKQEAPKPLRALLGPIVCALIFAGFLLAAALALILPPPVAALAILFWILATFALIVAVPGLDPQVLGSGNESLLLPRRPISASPAPRREGMPLWSSRAAARAALLSHLLLVAALGAGLYATAPFSAS